jgi:hypothetical protein
MRDPKQIQSRADFVAFVAELEADLKSYPNEWENPTLETFLEALGARLQTGRKCAGITRSARSLVTRGDALVGWTHLRIAMTKFKPRCPESSVVSCEAT